MAKPEIARRCPVCGASIREAAFFCPQCGEHLARPTLEERPTSSTVTTPLVELATDRDEAKPRDFRGAEAQKLEPNESPATPAPKSSTDKGLPGTVRNQMQRAPTAARGVEEVKQRVQKMRKMSGVVIDEAGYDPSLRFVLVAAALFLLFLLILLLHKLIV